MKSLKFEKTYGEGPNEVELKVMEMNDPVFAASSAHAAAVSFPVSPSGLACTIELFLSLDSIVKAATSGQVAFTSTGVNQSVSLSITMPNPIVGQSYGVYLVVLSGGMILGAYKATDNVVIPIVGTPTVTW
jgi:hypothetical protein